MTLLLLQVTHWQHPRFHAYFPAGNSWPSILADMLSDAIGCVGFSWAASPACTELETIMLDWIARMVNLPNIFRPFEDMGRGGGVLQQSASDCILVCMLTARAQAIRHYKEEHGSEEDGAILSRMVAYCSKEAHSSVEKAAMICLVKIRILETDEEYALRGEVLSEAIKEDKDVGLIPFYVSATLGTTSCCSFDNLSEIGPVCTSEDLWLHVDAAYAGSALICPEFQYLKKGVEHASSFNMNPNKWMLVNFDCSTMWVRDRDLLTGTLAVDPVYLQHRYSDKAIDYRHVRLAKLFESFVKKDARFEVPCKVVMGLVCFRLKESNATNQRLLMAINASGELHMVPASLNNRYVIRFAICSEHATDSDVLVAWRIIQTFSTEVLKRSRSRESGSIEKRQPEPNGVVDDDEEPEEDVDIDDIEDDVFMFDPTVTLNHPLERPPPPPRRYKGRGSSRNMLVRMISDPKCYHPKLYLNFFGTLSVLVLQSLGCYRHLFFSFCSRFILMFSCCV
ncbi:PREDICTED: tyrosine decarboxylase-like [Priapulus caudatus]|uniref:Tyrosine decarboxylase-like n=1 Tax=Priapulus caudatus TaxID=37621 RepID=A0ABM1EH74_PRICU|nr:PREDICTED: tyrosine decarboxylase-like [Priapulus caudatus]